LVQASVGHLHLGLDAAAPRDAAAGGARLHVAEECALADPRLSTQERPGSCRRGPRPTDGRAPRHSVVRPCRTAASCADIDPAVADPDTALPCGGPRRSSTSPGRQGERPGTSRARWGRSKSDAAPSSSVSSLRRSRMSTRRHAQQERPEAQGDGRPEARSRRHHGGRRRTVESSSTPASAGGSTRTSPSTTASGSCS